MIKKISLFCLFFIFWQSGFSQKKTLDDFETTDGWSFIKSDGVNLSLNSAQGFNSNSIKFDYDFSKGTGYCGIQKKFPIYLPDNFEFSFYIKAVSPANNFEIKFIDSTGNNVWWVNNRNYDFPAEWKKIKIKKRHINFAWGPTEDHSLKRIDRIEFTVASFVGGKGTLWIDNLVFEPLPPEIDIYPTPIVTAKSQSFDLIPKFIVDENLNTYWHSAGHNDQYVTIDLKVKREFGGLKINWLDGHQAQSFNVNISEDGYNWEKVYAVDSNQSKVSFIRLSEIESRFIRLNLLKAFSDSGYGITDISFLNIKNSLTLNDFLIYTAKNSPKGYYPRYFSEEASFWTITGVNNDVKESLINEDGMVEIDKAKFSIEPLLKIENEYYNWVNSNSSQSLEKGFIPIPSVKWQCNNVELETKIFTSGEANINSRLYLRYKIQNNSPTSKTGSLFLLIRPFQVNPYYQQLNLPGGAGKIFSIRNASDNIYVDDKIIVPVTKFNSFSAVSFDEGNVIELIKNNRLPERKLIVDKSSQANGILRYDFNIEPGQEENIYLLIPFYNEQLTTKDISEKYFEERLKETIEFWENKVGYIKFNLPESANKIVNTYKSNLAYILINRDKAGIQPGSRSYERSWIRDGSLTSSALLKSGITEEVKDFIDWYAAYQYENGKVPCVVDSRGPDPVPEYDSQGQLIYLIREYFNFTKDTSFLRSKNENILNAVDYIESLIAQRSTEYFKNGNDSVRAYYGLVPESISHEGYSAKPMHSYWDNFFVLKGLKDAVEIQRILGKKESYQRIKKLLDVYKENLYNSINSAMKIKKIDYIPGCVELGDFDATSTTIALTPCNELANLPKPQVYNTFERYYEFFNERKDGKVEWLNYTPYENRLIGSFVLLDQHERVHQLIDYFLNDQYPNNWNAFAEVVWHNKKSPSFIGDIPHTWVGSDFINAVRSMFVYENEYDNSLVITAALNQSSGNKWIDAEDGISIENLPTYYGTISYLIKKENTSYIISITGNIELPLNGIKIKNFNGSKLPAKVFLNGKEILSFNNNEISINEFPAVVKIIY